MPTTIPATAPFASDDDIQVLARTIFGEARGEDRQGREMVASVIINRAIIDLGSDGKPDWWGDTVSEVCLKKYQFSCWLESDPNRWKILAITEADHIFAECLEIARAAVSGVLPDKSCGATHYLNPDLTAKLYGMPAWSKGHQPVAVHGRHAFYRVV